MRKKNHGRADEDLDDLLNEGLHENNNANTTTNAVVNTTGSGTEITGSNGVVAKDGGNSSPLVESFEIEEETESLVSKLSKGKLRSATDNAKNNNNANTNPAFRYQQDKLLLIGSLLCLFMNSRPNVCIGICITLLLVFGIALIISSRREHMAYHGIPMIRHDYSHVTSDLDLQLGFIDHWCIFGNDDGCGCDDPLDPISHAEMPGWIKAHKMNINLIQQATTKLSYGGSSNNIDVAFLGDSITEEWDGRWVGRNNSRFKQIKNIFQHYFNSTANGEHGGPGAKYNGVPLGIAGDVSPNILWRLQHGEMPPNFNPKVWWILLGLNDLGKRGCSEEVTLMGILRVVEEIQKKKPDAKIVINGLLPNEAYAYERAVRGGDNEQLAAVRKRKKKKKRKKRGQKKRHNRNDDDDGSSSSSSSEDDDDVESFENDKGGRQRPFRGRKRVPLLPSVLSINRELRRFADSEEHHGNVYYFDASKVFFVFDDYGDKVVNTDLMLDGVHPTAEGHRRWAEKIVKKLDGILGQDDNDSLGGGVNGLY